MHASIVADSRIIIPYYCLRCFSSLPNSEFSNIFKFSDISVVAWNQPWWDYLHHKNHQTPQTRTPPFPWRAACQNIYQHTASHALLLFLPVMSDCEPHQLPFILKMAKVFLQGGYTNLTHFPPQPYEHPAQIFTLDPWLLLGCLSLHLSHPQWFSH